MTGTSDGKPEQPPHLVFEAQTGRHVVAQKMVDEADPECLVAPNRRVG